MDHRPWLKSYDREVPASLTFPDELIPSILEKAAQKFSGQTALVFFGYSMTYQKLWQSAMRFSEALQQTGVKKGDRVALLLPNCPHFLIAYYGALRAGAVVVPTNPLYSEKEILFQFNDSGAECLVTLDLLFPNVEKILSQTSLKKVIVGGIQDFLPFFKKLLYPLAAKKDRKFVSVTENDTVIRFHKFMKQGGAEFKAPDLSGDDLAQLQYTGGTTGVAKGAMLTHKNLVSNNVQMKSWYVGIQEKEEVFISVLPFFHSYGMAAAMSLPICAGAKMVIYPRFVATDILKGITRYRVTAFPGIPSIYTVINSHKEIAKYDVSSIKFCLSGAAPLPVTVLEEFEKKTGGLLLEGYGLSEASPVTHCNPVRGKRIVGSIGLPVSGTDCRIVDVETGEALPQGETGELCIKGPQVMKGYWNRPDETEKTLKDGWLFTGDVARMDADGYFYIVERKKDMIISEGFNIYPREIEEFLLTHPKIRDAAVIGMPDKLRGERVIAYVSLKEGETAAADEIIRFCRESLVKYKVPRKVFFKEDIPTNIAGKKLRRVLREDAEKTR